MNERGLNSNTAAWHFIDIPRGARKSSIARCCPPPIGCVTTAIIVRWFRCIVSLNPGPVCSRSNAEGDSE